MIELKEIEYRGISVRVCYNKESDSFFAYSGIGNSCHAKTHKSPDAALIDVKEKINKFYAETPKSYKELAQKITDTLVWTGYEECYVDMFILKSLIKRFIEFRNDNSTATYDLDDIPMDAGKTDSETGII